MPDNDFCMGISVKVVSDMRIEDTQRNLYDREYATLPKRFRGFENWRLSYVRRIFSELAVVPEDQLLDVGVGGTGFTVIASALGGTFSVGTDISHVACVKARDYAMQSGASPRSHFVNSSATLLPFREASFSKIISNAVLEHLEDDDLALDELSRVASPRGRVLICVPNSYMFMALPLAILNLWNDRRVGHLRHYASTDLVSRGARRALRAIDVTFHAHVIKIVQAVIAMVIPAVRNPASRVWWHLERMDLDAKGDPSGMNVTVTFEKVAIAPAGGATSAAAIAPTQDMNR